MRGVKRSLSGLVDFFHATKDKNLRWREANQQRQVDLKHRQAMAEQALAAELKTRAAELEHRLALMKTQNKAELAMLKIRCKQDVEDYKQYLASLNKLKTSIQQSFTHLPESIAFTIHHHAKSLLHEMWESDDLEKKLQHEMRLIQFMTAVHEDARLHLEGNSIEKLPERTLQLLQRK